MKPPTKKELRVLLALEDNIHINLKGIQRNTGLHKARVQTSLNFLEEKGAITSYYPRIAFDLLGFKAVVFGFFGTDHTMPEFREKILDVTKKDKNISILTEILGIGKYDLYISELYRSVEDYHVSNKKKYYNKYKEMYRFVREWEIIHLPLPFIKCENTFATISNILKYEQGHLRATAHRYRGEMKLDDPVRLAVLNSFTKRGSLLVDRHNIAETTKVKESEVMSILRSLTNKGVLRGYAPRINVRAFGFKLRSLTLLGLDYSHRKELDELSKFMLKDPYNYFISECLLSSPWDLVIGSLHRNAEDYTRYLQRYHASLNYDKLVKDSQLFHLGPKLIKDHPFSVVALDLLE